MWHYPAQPSAMTQPRAILSNTRQRPRKTAAWLAGVSAATASIETCCKRGAFLMRRAIATIGAGPGGLTLARVLLQTGLRPRSMKPKPAQHQGGLPDLRADTRQRAPQIAGLHLLRPAGDDKRVMGKDGTILSDQPGHQSPPHPEADRGQLRAMPTSALPPQKSEH